jgi:hypothetical protein
MRKFTGAAVACLLLAQILLAPIAAAAPIRDTLESFEFFGTWAAHCDRPTSPVNSLRTVYETANGQVEFTESFGEGFEPNTYAVTDATVPMRGTIVLRIVLNGEIKQQLTMRQKRGRIRTMSNRDSEKGTFVVKNGIVTNTSKSTPWLSHCAQAR